MPGIVRLLRILNNELLYLDLPRMAAWCIVEVAVPPELFIGRA